jgi:hypothetical protein
MYLRKNIHPVCAAVVYQENMKTSHVTFNVLNVPKQF